MTVRLELPKQFSGSWEHLLIMTYGVDAPFFENSIWSELPTRCRNKIILADGQHYLEACAAYAQNGLVRYINQKYVVDGIYLPRAAHSKVILLTRPDEGRLFIGSGNLNWQGYASGGEMFTQFDFRTDQPDTLPAFLAVWDIVEELISRNSIGPAAVPYLRRLHEQTPWLFRSSPNVWLPVRSNLKISFLEQLKEAVNNEPVSELWVMAPFYDPRAMALKKLLEAFSPQHIHLVVQSAYTSLDPISVLDVLKDYPGKWEINPFISLQDDDVRTYVHAKLILLKTPTRAICLQGSPNLSQVALLLPVPQGNFETANLLIGAIDEFDELISSLGLGPATQDFSSLGISYQQIDKTQYEHVLDWQLVSADWQQDQLRLYFRGSTPAIPHPQIKIGANLYELMIVEQKELMWIVKLSPEMQQTLDGPIPIVVCWEENGSQHTTTPIYPCNIATLAREFQEDLADDQQLKKLGDFDLEDAELEKMLSELDSALPIDRRSIWKLAGKILPAVNPEENDDALKLSYADIDYEKLRRHPKILQYTKDRASGGQPLYGRSRLQIILSSITDHFQGLRDIAHGKSLIAKIGLSGNPEEGEDTPPEEDSKVKPKPVSKAHIRKILKGFIRRYLRGLKSQDFIELVGFDVVANNYVIFSHILWRLLEKGWVEQDFILDSFFQTWEFIWGGVEKVGYFSRLSEIEQALCLQLYREQHTDAQWIATIFYGAQLCQQKGWSERKHTLRNFYRLIISRHLIDIDPAIVEETWVYADSLMPYNRPLPGYIFQSLADLARYETQYDFLRELEAELGLDINSCEVDNKHSYHQKHLNRTAPGDVLFIKDPTNKLNKEVVIRILQFWMKFQTKDYYRIVNHTNTIICWYCTPLAEGLYYQADPLCDEDLVKITPALPNPWEADLYRIRDIAAQVDTELSLSLQSIEQQHK